MHVGTASVVAVVVAVVVSPGIAVQVYSRLLWHLEKALMAFALRVAALYEAGGWNCQLSCTFHPFSQTHSIRAKLRQMRMMTMGLAQVGELAAAEGSP